MSLGESVSVPDAGKMLSLFLPTNEEQEEKTVLGSADDLITVNWAGVGIGILLGILGMLDWTCHLQRLIEFEDFDNFNDIKNIWYIKYLNNLKYLKL